MNTFFLFSIALMPFLLKTGATSSMDWYSRPYSLLYVNAGETANIAWKFPAGAKAIIYEYKTSNTLKRGKRIANVFGNSTPEIMGKYEGKVEVQKSGALNILNAGVNDEGFYSITITYKLTSLTDEVEIKIQKAPSIVSFSSHPKYEVFYKGMSLSLICMAVGRPIPKVAWYKDKVLLREETGAVVFTIKSATKENSGKYTCVARNVVGKVNQTTEFVIYRRPYEIDFYHDAALDGTIYEGQSATFTCSAKGSPPITTYRLFHNGKKVTDMVKGVYNINKVQLEHDGEYCCVPVNKAGLGENMTTFLRVHRRPDYWKEEIKTEKITVKQISTEDMFTKHMILTEVEELPTKRNQRGEGTILYSSFLSVLLPLITTSVMKIFPLMTFS